MIDCKMNAWGIVTRGLSCVALLGMMTTAPLAQEAGRPTGEEVLQRYLEKTGGIEAYEKLTTVKLNATISVVGTDQGGQLVVLQKAPDKMMRTEVINGSETTRATDGKQVWMLSEMQGDQLVTGGEKAQFLREAVFNAELNWRKVFEKLENTGEAEVNGEACHVLKLTPKEGEPETRYYAKDSGLLVKMQMTVESPVGPLPIDAELGDYSEFDGIKSPGTIAMTVGGFTIKTTIDKATYNEPIPDETFAMPEKIKAMLDQ